MSDEEKEEEGTILNYSEDESEKEHGDILESISSDEEEEVGDILEPVSSDEEEIYEINQDGGGQEANFNADNFFELSDPATVNIARFRTEGREYFLQFRNTDQLDDLNGQLAPIFQRIVEQVSKGIDDNALMGFSFRHPDLTKGRILIPFRWKHAMNGDLILNSLNAVLQSNDQVQIDSREASVRVVAVTPPQGTGVHNAHKYLKQHDFLKDKRCIIQIKNTDDLCFARAIVVARAHVHKDDPSPVHNWENIRKSDRQHVLQTRVAKELMVQAGLADHKGACGFNEWPKFQAVLTDYQIKVFSKERFKDLVYKGPDAKHVLSIYHHNDHYSVITKMPGFFDRGYYCPHCDVPYNDKTAHRCKNFCPMCYKTPPCTGNYGVECEDCNLYFRNDFCFKRHKMQYVPKTSDGSKRQKKTTSTCDRIKNCKDCGKFCRRAATKEHRCSYYECPVCKKEVLKKGHLCYMQPLGNEQEVEDINMDDDENMVQDQSGFTDKCDVKHKFFFYDFETTQEKVLRQTDLGDVMEHEPNLCVVHTVCDVCRRSEMECNSCGQRTHVFKGPTCLDSFCKYLFGKGMKNIIAIAHNARGFDGQFILQYLYAKGHQRVYIVSKGLELMCISIGSIKIIDSLNFLPMPLAALPKTFGITELCKEYFPHFFNKKENYRYVGPYPSPDMYGFNSMKPAARVVFLEWYNQKIE